MNFWRKIRLIGYFINFPIFPRWRTRKFKKTGKMNFLLHRGNVIVTRNEFLDENKTLIYATENYNEVKKKSFSWKI